ncbi:hypothetical protein ACJZ2D_000159 [Fusarium nematophilum]
MGSSGVVSAGLRFCGHLPTGMMGFSGINLYNRAKTLGDIYDVIPHGRAFLQGLQLVGQVGCATFAWNFVMFAASGPADGVALFLIGVVDLVLTVLLLFGAVQQVRFMPRSYGGCDGAIDWKNGTDGRNYFLVVNESTTGYSSPERVCNAYVHNWAVTVACIVLYCLCTMSTLLVGGLESCLSTRNTCGSFKGLWSFLIFPITYPVGLVSPSIRFALRYTLKFLARGRSPRPHRSRRPIYTKMPRVGSEKSEILQEPKVLPAPVVDMITQRLHFADLVSLSQSSRQLRTAFFGHGDVAKELERLRQYCCEGNKKSQCKICDRQVCESCQFKTHVKKSYASHHLSSCRPACTRCFYLDHCHDKNRQNRQRNTKHQGTCPSSGAKADLELGEGSGRVSSYLTICRVCSEAEPRELARRMEEQDAAELRRLAKHPLVCYSCKDLLPSRGPRWWICGGCKTECRSGTHPSWA